MSYLVPAVAIITRTKDRPLMLRRAIESVLRQSFQNWLHVMVNDGGDMVTVNAVVSPYLSRYQGRLSVLHNDVSLGMQNAANRAIRETDSNYVVIHDDDDSWAATFLTECIQYLDSKGSDDAIQGVATQAVWVFEEIDKYGNIVELRRQDYFPFKQVNLFTLAGHNAFPPIAFLYRRKAHQHIGYFDQRFNYLGDWDFNLRFLSKFDIGVIDKQLAYYHWRHKGSGSSYGNTVTDGIDEHQELRNKMLNHYLRCDLEKGMIGLGFLMNLSSTSSGHSAMLHDLLRHSNAVLDRVGFLEHMSRYFERITADLKRYYSLTRFILGAGKRVTASLIGAASSISRRLAPRVPRPNDSPIESLQEALSQAEIVSLDVFDTALLRKTKCPTDVFLYMETEARRILGKPNLQFPELRVNAETVARMRAEQRGHGDTNLKEIYSVLQELTGVGDRMVNALIELEIRAEEGLIYANPELMKIVDLAGSTGKLITFTSDMYLPRSDVVRLLERNGFAVENILLSSETRVTKHSGELFELVAERFGGDAGRILHIGDNQWSDVEQAKRRGIKSLHWRPKTGQVPFVDQLTSYSGNWVRDLSSSIYVGLARKWRLSRQGDDTGETDFWRSIGYEVIGPLYLSFVSWVVRQAQKLDVERLFFLARDGYYLIKVFDILKERWNLAMDARYMYASRRLLNVPRIRAIDEEALTFLTTPNPCMSLKDFFDRIGLDPSSYANCISDFGFVSLDQSLTTKDGVFISPQEHQSMRELMKRLTSDILVLAADERSRLLSYLSDVGIASRRSAVVDIGWQASSIKSLQDLLNMNGGKSTLQGLYFSTWRFAQGALNAGCQVDSFFVHLDQPEHRADLIREAVELLELFFGAPHPSVVGLKKSNGCWQPIYGGEEIDNAQREQLDLARQTAMEFVIEAVDLAPGPEFSPPAFAYLDTVLERILSHPLPREAQILGRLSHRNTFGGNGPLRYVAKPPSDRERKNRGALRKAYDECYWKRGFLAQLTEKEKTSLGLL